MKIAEIIETLETIDNNYEIFVWERQALDSAIELLERSEWIPVSEALPEKDKDVLISLEWGVDIGQYDGDGWRSEWINHYDDDNVLAWQSLPKPYREDGEA